MAPRHALHIRRHELTWRVAEGTRGLPDAGIGGFRTGDAAEQLAADLDSGVPGGGVWLIRRLDVDVAVTTSASETRVAAALASGIAAELRRVAVAGPDADTVKWYPDGAALLQQYLTDLVAGTAEQRWEYGSLHADTTASMSEAIVRQLHEQPDDALEALRRMPADGARIVDAIAAADAPAALTALAAADEAERLRPFDAVVTAAHVLHATSRLTGDDATNALRLFLAAVIPERGGAGAITAARALEAARAIGTLRGMPAGSARAVRAAFAASSWRVLDTALDPIATWPREPVTRLLDAVVPPEGVSPPGVVLHTHIGGIFLLLPLLADVPLVAQAAGWPACDSVAADRVTRYLTTISALGTERNEAAVADPVLRMATGLPARLDATVLSEWADRCVGDRDRSAAPLPATALGPPFDVDPATNGMFASAGAELLGALARRLPGLAGSSAEYLWRNVLDFAATVEVEPVRYVVRLGRPTLHLLLTMTGLDRQQFRLEDEEGPEWVLTQGE